MNLKRIIIENHREKTRKFAVFQKPLIITITGGCAMLNGRMVSPVQEASPTLSAAAATPTTTATYTHVSTSILTSTPVFIPTLPEEEARLRLLDLLTNNGGCHLPCLWGITPGSSTHVEAQTILTPLSAISDFTDFNSGPSAIDPYLTDGDLKISTSIRFLTHPDNDIISFIAFNSRASREMPDPNNPGKYYPQLIYNSTSFGEKLAFYMLPHILSEYGRPSSVLIKTNPGPSPRGGMGLFYLLLLFPDQGILVQYSKIMRMSGINVLGCPSNAHVELELYPSGNGASFMDLLSPSWHDVLPLYKPLEKATSMSLDQFYQTFRQPTDQCLLTPADLWPTFEPGGG